MTKRLENTYGLVKLVIIHYNEVIFLEYSICGISRALSGCEFDCEHWQEGFLAIYASVFWRMFHNDHNSGADGRIKVGLGLLVTIEQATANVHMAMGLQIKRTTLMATTGGHYYFNPEQLKEEERLCVKMYPREWRARVFSFF